MHEIKHTPIVKLKSWASPENISGGFSIDFGRVYAFWLYNRKGFISEVSTRKIH